MTKEQPEPAQKSVPAFSLPPKLDHLSTTSLFEFLAANRGSSVVIDGAQSQGLTAQSAQFIVAAARAWKDDGTALSINDPRGQIGDDFSNLGLISEVQDILLKDGGKS